MTPAQNLKNQLAGLPYIGVFTRDVAAVGETVVYGVVGFKPRLILFKWVLNAAGPFGSYAVDASNLGGGLNVADCFTTANYPTTRIDCFIGGGRQDGYVSSLNNDGFTIVWTKTATPTGTIHCYYIAFP